MGYSRPHKAGSTERKRCYLQMGKYPNNIPAITVLSYLSSVRCPPVACPQYCSKLQPADSLRVWWEPWRSPYPEDTTGRSCTSPLLLWRSCPSLLRGGHKFLQLYLTNANIFHKKKSVTLIKGSYLKITDLWCSGLIHVPGAPYNLGTMGQV